MTLFNRYRRLIFILFTCHATYILVNWYIIGKLLTTVNFVSDDKDIYTFINIVEENNFGRKGKWIVRLNENVSNEVNKTSVTNIIDSTDSTKSLNQERHSSLKDTLSSWLSSDSYKHSTREFEMQQVINAANESDFDHKGKQTASLNENVSKLVSQTSVTEIIYSTNSSKSVSQKEHSYLKDATPTWLLSESYKQSSREFEVQQKINAPDESHLRRKGTEIVSLNENVRKLVNKTSVTEIIDSTDSSKSLNQEEHSSLKVTISAWLSSDGHKQSNREFEMQRDQLQQPTTPLPPQNYHKSNSSEFHNNLETNIPISTMRPTSIKPTWVQKTKKKSGLIIDTSGCKIPELDPFDPTVFNLIQLFKPYYCPGPPLFMTPEPNGIVRLNISVLEKYYNTTSEDVKCYFEAIIRKYEEPGNVRETDFSVAPIQRLIFDVPMEYEYIASKCFLSNNYTHEQYLPLVQLKKEVEEVKSKIKPESPLNVILLGIDSVSKLNFFRHFPKTKAFLKNKIKSFDMKGYTKIGDNTFPNLMAMLTGHFVDYYWDETMRDTFFFDNVSFIWKDYANNGYRTFYAEDSPYYGTFNYLKRGFRDPPTDYYYRPMALAIEESFLRAEARKTNSPCLNSELETDLMYDYLKNFVKTMDKRPYFAFCMVSILTHDFLNSAGRADTPADRILHVLQDEGALNASALVIFSDHGLRFGDIRQTYIGKFEERMPFMYMYFPEWFLQQHPDIENNLSINQDRLMTLFDIHATLKHLLHLNQNPTGKTDELGLSLLNEIPENRTCTDAHILQHWCPCNNFNIVSVNDSTVIKVSQALVKHVNDLLLPHADVCATLEVAEIMDARLGLPNEYLLKYQRNEDDIHHRVVVLGDEPPTLGDYLVTVKVKPGGGILEGTVRYDAEKALPRVVGVSRISIYGDTSWCINSQTLKLYCYCKKQLT